MVSDGAEVHLSKDLDISYLWCVKNLINLVIKGVIFKKKKIR